MYWVFQINSYIFTKFCTFNNNHAFLTVSFIINAFLFVCNRVSFHRYERTLKKGNFFYSKTESKQKQHQGKVFQNKINKHQSILHLTFLTCTHCIPYFYIFAIKFKALLLWGIWISIALLIGLKNIHPLTRVIQLQMPLASSQQPFSKFLSSQLLTPRHLDHENQLFRALHIAFQALAK